VNINMLRDADNDAGFYAAACARNPLATWGGATVYVSSDGGVSYASLTTIASETTMGYTTDALGNFYGGNIPDEFSHVNVVPLQGTLSSTNFAGLLAGTNMAVIGDEILFFRDATLESNGSYTLTGFLRGRRGSEYAMGTHAAADRFVLVSHATMVRIAQTTADIGVAKLFKPVGAGSSLAGTTAQAFTNAGTGLKPYAPVHLGGGRNAAGDLTLKWVRRGRTSGEWRDSVDVPVGETTEAYEVEILNASTGTPEARPFTIGINIHSGGGSLANNTTIANLMASRGLKRGRMDLFYDGSPWALARDQIQKINNAGGSVEVSLQISYQWDNTIYTGGALATIEADAYTQTYAVVDAMKDLVHDFELLNEINNRPETSGQVTQGTGQLQSAYTGQTAFISIAAVLRGMADAIHDLAASSGLPLRVILGTVSRDWGFLAYMQTLGVNFDVVGWHVYSLETDTAIDSDTWWGAGGPITQLAAFGKPIVINEFNCSEIYDGAYENALGGTLTEAGFRSNVKHLKSLWAQTNGTIESVCFYELVDDPAKAAPENHFGLAFNLAAPKVSLYIATAFGGGTLTAAERTAITSRTGLLTDAEITAMQSSASRTFTGLTAPTVTYTAAEQTADFGSPQATVNFRVYQLSSVVGRGHAASGSV
jgi:hypothetical protein